MAHQFNVASLTLGPIEQTELSKFIFMSLVETGDLAKYHDIQTGIFYREQIPFVGNLGLVGKKIVACNPTPNAGQVTFTEKFWTPELIGDRFSNCAIDANRIFKAFRKRQKIEPDFFNNIGTEEEGVILNLVETALKLMINRYVWMGDKSMANVSAGGYLKNGVDASFFTAIDGLWKQIIAAIPTTATNYVAIAENAAASYALQSTLATDFSIKLFRNMWNKADSRLKQRIGAGEKLYLHVTPQIAENWADYKEDKSLVFTLANAEGGGLQNLYRNIEIVTRYDWKADIEAYFDNGTKYNLPNRALMTTSENIPVGTTSEQDLNTFTSFYDLVGRQNIIDFDMMLDAKFLLNYMAVAAY